MIDRIPQDIVQKFGIEGEARSWRLLYTPEERAGRLAQDAQPELITLSNSGIPMMLTSFIDPKVINILTSPMKAAEILGETKKGDWVMDTAQFPVREATGEVSSYGDYSETGVAGANINWVGRQSYHYQTNVQYGEREMERMGVGRIDWASSLKEAAVLTLNKFQNATYFFGVDGLANYGLINDPTLTAAITPLTYESVTTWAAKAVLSDGTGPLAILNDVRALFAQLVSQANGIVDLNMASPMTLVMSPTSQTYLTATTVYGMNVQDMIKKNFPRIRIETAPEYALTSGNLVQLIVDEMVGDRTATCAFTEKLRAHPIIVQASSFRQKLSQGTWGTIIQRPFLIAQMLGV